MITKNIIAKKPPCCDLCGSDIQGGEKYYRVDNGDYHIHVHCLDDANVDDVCSLFGIDNGIEALSLCSTEYEIVKMELDAKPKNIPPMKGQLVVMDNGALGVITADGYGGETGSVIEIL